jgi:hypothetical protein
MRFLRDIVPQMPEVVEMGTEKVTQLKVGA